MKNDRGVFLILAFYRNFKLSKCLVKISKRLGKKYFFGIKNLVKFWSFLIKKIAHFKNSFSCDQVQTFAMMNQKTNDIFYCWKDFVRMVQNTDFWIYAAVCPFIEITALKRNLSSDGRYLKYTLVSLPLLCNKLFHLLLGLYITQSIPRLSSFLTR